MSHRTLRALPILSVLSAILGVGSLTFAVLWIFSYYLGTIISVSGASKAGDWHEHLFLSSHGWMSLRIMMNDSMGRMGDAPNLRVGFVPPEQIYIQSASLTSQGWRFGVPLLSTNTVIINGRPATVIDMSLGFATCGLALFPAARGLYLIARSQRSGTSAVGTDTGGRDAGA